MVLAEDFYKRFLEYPTNPSPTHHLQSKRQIKLQKTYWKKDIYVYRYLNQKVNLQNIIAKRGKKLKINQMFTDKPVD